VALGESIFIEGEVMWKVKYGNGFWSKLFVSSSEIPNLAQLTR